MKKWISISDAAQKWGITEQTARRYCRNGLVPRAFMENHIWFVPSRAKNPVKDGCYRLPSPPLLQKILDQKSSYDRELYNHLQVNMAYSSSRLSSNRLTRNHVEYLFKKNRLLVTNESMKLNDYVEVRNHFLCVDYILEEGMSPLKPAFVIDLHRMLFSDICGHKFRPIKCGEFRTTEAPLNTEGQVLPNEIKSSLSVLFKRYEKLEQVTLFDILDLHVQFERIRPFEDGNGRIGRLIMLKECLRRNLAPFIIDDKRRFEYLKGIQDWDDDPSLLLGVCTECQARFQSQTEVLEMINTHSRMVRQFRKE